MQLLIYEEMGAEGTGTRKLYVPSMKRIQTNCSPDRKGVTTEGHSCNLESDKPVQSPSPEVTLQEEEFLI